MSNLADSVFISYRHESDEFAKLVRDFAEKIRSKGIQVEFDQFERQEKSLGDPDEGWARWCKKRTEAKCVLVVKSESWFQAADQIEADIGSIPGETGGRGVSSEAAALASRLYQQRQRNDFLRFIELPGHDVEVPQGWPKQSFDLEKEGEFDLLFRWISKRLGLPLPGEKDDSVTKTVFLADPGEAHKGNFQRLHDHLEASGWRTLSAGSLPDDSDQQALSRSLESCQALVALVEKDGPTSGARSQLKLANELGIQCISFLELAHAEEVDPSNDPAEWGTLLTGEFIEFCDNLVHRLESHWTQSERNIEAVKRPPSSNRQAILKIIDCTGKDVSPKQEVRSWLEAMKFKEEGGTFRFQTFGGGDKISEQFQKLACQGFLFLFDQSTVENSDGIEDLCDGLLLIQTYLKDINRQPIVGFLYWPPPGNIDWDEVLQIGSERFRPMHYNEATTVLPDLLTQLWTVTN
jgi:hypothetical protein